MNVLSLMVEYGGHKQWDYLQKINVVHLMENRSYTYIHAHIYTHIHIIMLNTVFIRIIFKL